MSWRMHGLVDRPRVVSNSAVILDPTTGFRQAVVKIQSLQVGSSLEMMELELEMVYVCRDES